MEIVLEGPAKNALGTALLTSLRDRLAATREPLLLTGAGDAFSAGLNLKELATFDRAAMGAFLDLLQDVVLRLFHHPAPTLAAVNGHAIAGGAILARACDHAVATTHLGAKIGLNEVELGLRFPPRLLAVLTSRLPARHRHELLLGAGLFAPPDALRLGLVDELAADPLAAARARLERWSALPRAAYAAGKHDLQGRVGAPDPVGDQRFVEDVLPTWTSDELRERIRARLERGRPAS